MIERAETLMSQLATTAPVFQSQIQACEDSLQQHEQVLDRLDQIKEIGDLHLSRVLTYYKNISHSLTRLMAKTDCFTSTVWNHLAYYQYQPADQSKELMHAKLQNFRNVSHYRNLLTQPIERYLSVQASSEPVEQQDPFRAALYTLFLLENIRFKISTIFDDKFFVPTAFEPNRADVISMAQNMIELLDQLYANTQVFIRTLPLGDMIMESSITELANQYYAASDASRRHEISLSQLFSKDFDLELLMQEVLNVLDPATETIQARLQVIEQAVSYADSIRIKNIDNYLGQARYFVDGIEVFLNNKELIYSTHEWLDDRLNDVFYMLKYKSKRIQKEPVSDQQIDADTIESSRNHLLYLNRMLPSAQFYLDNESEMVKRVAATHAMGMLGKKIALIRSLSGLLTDVEFEDETGITQKPNIPQLFELTVDRKVDSQTTSDYDGVVNRSMLLQRYIAALSSILNKADSDEAKCNIINGIVPELLNHAYTEIFGEYSYARESIKTVQNDLGMLVDTASLGLGVTEDFALRTSAMIESLKSIQNDLAQYGEIYRRYGSLARQKLANDHSTRIEPPASKGREKRKKKKPTKNKGFGYL